MFKVPTFLLVAFCAAAFSQPSFAAGDKAKAKAASEIYKQEGEALQKKINSGKVEFAEAEKAVMKMFEQAQIVVTELSKSEPKATKLLQSALKLAPEMKKWSFQDVMDKVHDAKHADFSQKNIGLDLSDEKNKAFLDPVHTMAHPLMALGKIKEKKLDAAKEQVDEGLEQMVGAMEMFK